MLSLMPLSSGPVPRHCGRLADELQDDFVGADAEQLAEPAHLGHLRHPSSALPEIDRLGLDANPQRQFKLGPSPVLAERSDRLHTLHPLTALNYNRTTRYEQL
jgi:hypothetical protein